VPPAGGTPSSAPPPDTAAEPAGTPPAPPPAASSTAATPAASAPAASRATGPPAASSAAPFDFHIPPYCRDFVALGQWAEAYSNTSVELAVRVVRVRHTGLGRWTLYVDIESRSTDGRIVEPFLGIWTLIPLHGDGQDKPAQIPGGLKPGARRRLTITFELAAAATPAWAFFEDDDFPVCFQVGRLRAGPQQGVHPLS